MKVQQNVIEVQLSVAPHTKMKQEMWSPRRSVNNRCTTFIFEIENYIDINQTLTSQFTKTIKFYMYVYYEDQLIKHLRRTIRSKLGGNQSLLDKMSFIIRAL